MGPKDISRPLRPLRGKVIGFHPDATISRIQTCISDLYGFSLAWSIPSRSTTALMVGTLLLKKQKLPYWGIPSEWQSDRGTHFSGHMVQSIRSMWPILDHFHCTYHTQFSGSVGCINDTIKAQLREFSEASNLPWPKAPSTVLC